MQDERALIGEGDPFDTLSIIGVDVSRGGYFAQSFENHGFERRYELEVDGSVWTLSGAHERATIAFSDDDPRQTITWEWKPADRWLPLCDRVATRTD